MLGFVVLSTRIGLSSTNSTSSFPSICSAERHAPYSNWLRIDAVQIGQVDIYTPIFAMSRVGGWVAHVLEYQDENRLIRPRARYVGPDDQAFVRIDER